MKYRIIKHNKGKYSVQYRIHFLFWSWWRGVTEPDLVLNGNYTSIIEELKIFKKKKEAKSFIRSRKYA